MTPGAFPLDELVFAIDNQNRLCAIFINMCFLVRISFISTMLLLIVSQFASNTSLFGRFFITKVKFMSWQFRASEFPHLSLSCIRTAQMGSAYVRAHNVGRRKYFAMFGLDVELGRLDERLSFGVEPTFAHRHVALASLACRVEDLSLVFPVSQHCCSSVVHCALLTTCTRQTLLAAAPIKVLRPAKPSNFRGCTLARMTMTLGFRDSVFAAP